jgi:phosphoserine phosphatase
MALPTLHLFHTEQLPPWSVLHPLLVTTLGATCPAITSQAPQPYQHTTQISLDALLPLAAMQALRKALAPLQVDALCLPADLTPPQLLLADMDSTIVTSETLDELAHFAGVGPQVADITRRAMNGELDFEAALNARVALLKGLPLTVVDTVLSQTSLMPGAKTLIKGLKQHGTTCILISGGFTVFTGAIAQQCGFDHHVGNTLAHANGLLTGEVTHPIVDKHTKLATLQQFSQQLGAPPQAVWAMGDGANDLPMLQAAGLGIGVKPKPIVAEALANCLLYNPLDCLLKLI